MVSMNIGCLVSPHNSMLMLELLEHSLCRVILFLNYRSSGRPQNSVAHLPAKFIEF